MLEKMSIDYIRIRSREIFPFCSSAVLTHTVLMLRGALETELKIQIQKCRQGYSYRKDACVDG
jgi:hypothetical protein